jgi:phosphoribosyl 1,2-cyclic phosphate phosphodiesterase
MMENALPEGIEAARDGLTLTAKADGYDYAYF